MALLTALVFLALAATCKTLDLGDEDRCPCKKEHTTDIIEKWLVYPGEDGEMNYSNFGIGCRIHKIDQEFANRIYGEDNMASQLRCYDGPTASGPWCKSKWCYIDEDKYCSLDSKYGRLGLKYSHATCGNLKQGWPEHAIKSLAASLKGDPLRVLHLESTLDGGYMGNSHCVEETSASGASRVRCDHSLLAEFWSKSLKELKEKKVRVKPMLIKKSDRIDDHFKNITDSFHNYSEQGAMKFPAGATNFDLCAFATGLGWADLCSGTVALTHERQEMTYLIELYAAPAFMVSKSICILAKPWWWIKVFSWEAWVFFGSIVFIFTVLMHVFDDDFRKDCIEHILRNPIASWRDCWSACVYAASSLCTCFLGIGEALIKQKPKSINHPEKKSCASWCVRKGLSLFIFVTTTLYASSLTFELITRRENGQYPSLEEAKNNISGVTVCLHQVYQTWMKPHESPNSKINSTYFTDWEELKKGLENGTCHAAIVEEDAWNTWRARDPPTKLCDFYKSLTPTFYMPTGAPVSRRAYRTLESFRFRPSAVHAFELSNEKLEEDFKDLCPSACKTSGAEWHVFGTVALVACSFCVCGFLVLVYQKCHRATEARGGPRADLEAGRTEARGDPHTDAEAGPEQLEQPGRPQYKSSGSTETTTTGWNSDASQLWQL